MKKAFLIMYVCLTYSDIVCQEIESFISIERYRPSRDRISVKKILEDHRENLMFESLGYENGTTEKYLEKPGYITNVIRFKNQTVGFISYKTYTKRRPGRLGMIHLIGIDKDYQRRGYGKKLLHHTIIKLKKLKTFMVWLLVKRDNKIARSFYEKENFICKTPAHMQTHSVNLIYERIL